MKVMIKLIERETNKEKGYFFKGFKNIDEVIKYCNARTTSIYICDYEVIR